MGDPNPFKNREEWQDWIVDSNQVVRLKWLKNEEQLEEGDPSAAFHPPTMTHQIYGQNENIFGYANPTVDLLIAAGSQSVHVVPKFDSKIPSHCDLEADELLEPVQSILAPEQEIKDLNAFRQLLREEKSKFRPHPGGQELLKWPSKTDPANITFELHKYDGAVDGFQEFFRKLQPWMMFYIDAASFIDISDVRWRCFILYEKSKTPTGAIQYVTAGFLTVYEYYNYPMHIRPRLSQILIFPPYQNQGLGTKLYLSVLKDYATREDVRDFTVEDPTLEFTKLRNVVDTQVCLKLPSFSKEKVLQGFSKEMVQEANDKYKLNKRQVRIVFEVAYLFYKSGGEASEEVEYKDFRILVKRRLYIPFKREEIQMKKLKKILSEEEYQSVSSASPSQVEKLQTLQTQYEEIKSEYAKIVNAISAKTDLIQ